MVILIFCLGLWVGIKYEKFDYERVVDGDTFWVINRRDGSEWKVRLWGVDAPDEKKCYFNEATKILENALAGEDIVMERHGYDGFGRILAKVYVNGKNLEETLVATGAAMVYEAADVHDELKPSAEYIESLRKIEEVARKNKVGVWSAECFRSKKSPG